MTNEQREELAAALRSWRAREQEAREAQGRVVAAIRAARGVIQDGHRSAVLMDAGGTVVWLPTDNPQCVAHTTRGERCKNPVFDGQVWTWDGPIAVVPAEWTARMMDQVCKVHEGGGARGYESTEWVLVRDLNLV